MNILSKLSSLICWVLIVFYSTITAYMLYCQSYEGAGMAFLMILFFFGCLLFQKTNKINYRNKKEILNITRYYYKKRCKGIDALLVELNSLILILDQTEGLFKINWKTATGGGRTLVRSRYTKYISDELNCLRNMTLKDEEIKHFESPILDRFKELIKNQD